jgi:hypothetical protein
MYVLLLFPAFDVISAFPLIGTLAGSASLSSYL